jgi:hypothetical protein
MSNSQLLSQLVNQIPGRNRIINGSCRIAQRGSLVCASGQSGYGGPDRFTAGNGNAGGQFTQSAGAITWGGIALPAVVQTVNSPLTNSSGGNYWSGISQAIEGANCFDLLGQPATVSFIFNASRAGNYSFALRDYVSTNNSFVTTFNYAAANTPQKIVITIPTIPTSLTTTNTNNGGMWLNIGFINTGGTYQTSTLGVWQTGNYIYAAGSMNWSVAANDFIAATNIKLEAGSKATVMEPIQFGHELLLCQRYYQFFGNGQFIGAGSCNSSTLAYMMIDNAAGMRVVPTITQSNTQIYCGAVVNVTSVGNNYSGANNQVAVGVNVASGLTAGQGAMWYTATGTLTLSAEL